MVLEYGTIVFVGFVLLGLKVPKWIVLRALAHAIWIDIAVTVLAYSLHWGTMTGVMAAAVAGLMTSVATTIGVKMYGYVKNNEYYPGYFHVNPKELKLKEKKDVKKKTPRIFGKVVLQESTAPQTERTV